jgi:hypothetical protein
MTISIFVTCCTGKSAGLIAAQNAASVAADQAKCVAENLAFVATAAAGERAAKNAADDELITVAYTFKTLTDEHRSVRPSATSAGGTGRPPPGNQFAGRAGVGQAPRKAVPGARAGSRGLRQAPATGGAADQ